MFFLLTNYSDHISELKSGASKFFPGINLHLKEFYKLFSRR